jgi:SAM-dependent methyltransferase
MSSETSPIRRYTMINYDRFAGIYDIDMGYNIGSSDAPFYLTYAGSRSPVLELGCGTGRLIKPMVENHIHVVGIDCSLQMLQRARRNLNGCNSERYRLICGDMRTLCLKQQFRLAICAFSTYSKLLSENDQAAFFHRVHDHLQPGGILLLDMFVQPPEFQKIPDAQFIDDYNNRPLSSRKGSISRQKRVWKDVEPQVNKIELKYTITDAQGNQSQFSIIDFTRYSSKEQIEAHLAKSGLRFVNIFGDYNRDVFTENSSTMIFEARRTD